MPEELLQFELQKVFRNKKDERGIVVKNKARLVSQGYTQEEGIDYDKVFAPVARIEAIRLFLAYASYIGFIVYQIDVKSAFLYGTIEDEVYVCQPPGFEDLHFLDKVYKVEKALYGLHQALRAWYETVSTYLLENRFRRGTIDKILFIKKDKSDILLVQVYVDDIIFGSTKKNLCLQVQQKEDGIFISQDKYVAKILKKFDFAIVKTASTPIKTNKALVKDEEAEAVDVHLYRSMIGSLMYLTASRPDIMFVVCTCARFQVTSKTSNIHVVKRIFRYLKGQPKLGLWYPGDSSFDLEAFSDSDYAGASLDRKSTMRALVDKKKVIITNTSIRSDLNLEDAGGTDCLPTATIFEELARMGYEKPSPKLIFYKAFFSPQWKFLIHTITQCLSAKTTASKEFSITMASAIICLATNQKFNLSKYIFDAMVKHLEGGVKFLMYPQFVQVFINQQLGDMSHHKKTYVNPSHTKKIFANMKREGKDFSRRVTPLFATMMVQANQEEGENSDIPIDSHSTPIITPPSSSKPQKKKSSRK
ncbi:putative ribonuclease H-like domain-containing protein [Tanacetum coccineum]